MNLTLVISSLATGGAERVISIMANYWAERGEKVTLLTFDTGGEPSYSLHAGVRHRPLKLEADSPNAVVGLFRNLRRLQVLRRAVRESRPDLVISFVDKTNVVTLLATLWMKIPVIVSERIDPSSYQIGKIWNLLRQVSYGRADALVCQTPRALAYFRPVTDEKGHVIPNPVAPLLPNKQEREQGDSEGRGRVIVGMGRLTAQKGFDLLLRAFKILSPLHPHWSLKILGDGPLLKELQAQVASFGLSGRIELPGRVSDPYFELSRADIFVLSSRFEGFPNALLEAMACGLPVVSFDCPSGPREIIRDGVDGLLVPPEDVNALAATLGRLMGDDAERKRLAKRAPEVLNRFGLDEVMGKWDELFGRINKLHSA